MFLPRLACSIIDIYLLQNIHDVRDSWNGLRKLVSGSAEMASSDWWTGLAATKWLDHICSILAAARRVVEITSRIGSSCLVHCSDGWDRTTQIVSLAELMMDPYYRTFMGFAGLIEKEWISFGHQFATRHGIFDGSEKNQRAPVFLQFMDCTWQLLRQFPNQFEFTETFLIYLMDQASCNLFSTFAFDSESSRLSATASSPTNSVWSILPMLKRVYQTCNVPPNIPLGLISGFCRYMHESGRSAQYVGDSEHLTSSCGHRSVEKPLPPLAGCDSVELASAWYRRAPRHLPGTNQPQRKYPGANECFKTIRWYLPTSVVSVWSCTDPCSCSNFESNCK